MEVKEMVFEIQPLKKNQLSIWPKDVWGVVDTIWEYLEFIRDKLKKDKRIKVKERIYYQDDDSYVEFYFRNKPGVTGKAGFYPHLKEEKYPHYKTTDTFCQVTFSYKQTRNTKKTDPSEMIPEKPMFYDRNEVLIDIPMTKIINNKQSLDLQKQKIFRTIKSLMNKLLKSQEFKQLTKK